jgi:hypothetical protein
MQVWTTTPKVPAVSHVAAVNAGINPIVVTVLVGGLPKVGASVCLWKNLEDYQQLTTNGVGQATFTFNTPTAGSIRVVATAANMTRYEGTINVNAATGAMPVVESLAVDDDSIAGTSGNGNGVIDAGETIDLKPAIRNKGAAISPPVNATLTNITSGIVVLDATAAVPSLAPGALADASDSWRIHVSETPRTA